MNHAARVRAARLSLEGLSLGDAFGMHIEFDSSVDRPGARPSFPLPAGAVRAGLEAAADLGPGASVGAAVEALGNGSSLLAADTVPFALWCAATSLGDFPGVLQRTASGLGDADTNCAIVGGVVALFVGEEGIPSAWLERREPLPEWIEGESRGDQAPDPA